MIQSPSKMPKAPKIQRMSIDNWKKGVISAYDDGRMPIDGLLRSSNVWLDQDGVVRPRPGLQLAGPQPLGDVKGQIFEFRKVVGTESSNWWASLQTVDGVTNLYIAQYEDSTWTKIPGKDYHNDSEARFSQLQNALIVTTGKDKLSIYDITNDELIPYAPLTKPNTPTATPTGLTGSDYKMYYAVTANSKVGETEASTHVTVSIGTPRDIWDKDTQNIKISWTAVTGETVESYNIYAGLAVDGAGDPKLYAIATGLDPSTLEFTDNGTAALNENRPAPVHNSTDGPTVARSEVINGRVFLTGDAEEPYLVRFGGEYKHELDFSPANGGGFTSVGNGTKELPIRVVPFRDAKGSFQITVLCQGLSGFGKRYFLTPNTMTYGNTTFSFFTVTEDNGRVGTDAPDSVIQWNDSLYYLSTQGFKTTGTKPQFLNLLSTDGVDEAIRTSIPNINTKHIHETVGLEHMGNLFWMLPVNANKNNQIWVLQMLHGGAWMLPWTIEGDWMWLATTDSGKTEHMVLSNNKIYRFSYDNPSQDDGVPFITSGDSGQIYFSKDHMEMGDDVKLTFTFLRPKGLIALTVTGKNDDGDSVISRGELDYTKTNSAGGWTDPLMTWTDGYSWTDIITVPEDISDPTVTITIETDEVLRWVQFAWTTTGANVDYSVSKAVATYIDAGLIEDD